MLKCVKCNATMPGFGILCSGCAQVKLLEEQNEILRRNNSSSADKAPSEGGGTSWLIIIIFLFLIYQGFSKIETKEYVPASPTSASTSYKNYVAYREKVLKEGWIPYIRNNQIADVDRNIFPELQYCFEDVCELSFVKQSDSTKVRNISYAICSYDRYYGCPGQPNGFKNVTEDLVLSKEISDSNFLKFLEKMSHYN